MTVFSVKPLSKTDIKILKRLKKFKIIGKIHRALRKHFGDRYSYMDDSAVVFDAFDFVPHEKNFLQRSV